MPKWRWYSLPATVWKVGGENWLIPVDAELKLDTNTEQEAIALHSVITAVSSASSSAW